MPRRLTKRPLKNFNLTEPEIERLAFAAGCLRTSEVAILRDALALYYGSRDPMLLKRQALVASAVKESKLPADPFLPA